MFALELEAPVGSLLPCRSFDPELFFAESPEDVEYAKSLCGDCPVRVACLSGAIERREPWGVWGGELFIQGVVVARKRPRGRPRKDDIAATAAVEIAATAAVEIAALAVPASADAA
jgi:WhiB family transcriptional regulator, redox-sensing transcriptional regulator